MARYEFKRLRKNFDTFEVFENGQFLGIVDHMPFLAKKNTWRLLIDGRSQMFHKLTDLEKLLKARRW